VVVHNATDFGVTILHNQQEHTHDEILSTTTKRGIDEHTKTVILRLFKANVTFPTRIQDNLKVRKSENN
jgi:hypothetical protein